MEAKTNYTIVGIIVLLLTAGVLSAILWLSAGFNSKSYSYYTVYLREAASGLNGDSPVKFNGVQVGNVSAIKLNKNDPRQVEITLSIEEGTPITTSTSATLISQGITGVTYVGLSAASDDLTPLEKMPGEPYPVIPAKPSLFNQLDAVLKEASDSINSASKEVKRIFTEENAKYVRLTLSNMERFSEVMANNSSSIDSALKSADVFLANASLISKDFPQIVKDLRAGINNFNALSIDLSHAGKSVTNTMGSGNNTLNKLSEQTIPQANLLLRKLNAISANIELLSNTMRQNPSVIIRGTKPSKLGPGE